MSESSEPQKVSHHSTFQSRFTDPKDLDLASLLKSRAAERREKLSNTSSQEEHDHGARVE